MANTDIMGLLTGVSRQGINPMSSSSSASSASPVGLSGGFRERMLQRGAQRAERLGGAVRGLLGGGPTAQEQIATRMVEKQRQEQQAMADLDLSNPEDLMKLAKMQQVSGDLPAAVSTLKTAQTLAQQQSLREGLLRIARAQGNSEMVEFIEAGGDLQTASSKLLADKTVPSKTYQLTKPEEEEYELYFEDLSEEDKKKAGISDFLFGMFKDKDSRKKLFFKAERIFTNNPELGREGALKQALQESKTGDISVPDAGDTRTRRQVQQDKYSGIKE